MRNQSAVLAAVAGVLLGILGGPGGNSRAEEEAAFASLAAYEPIAFKPLTLGPAADGKSLDLFTSEHLERTPRDYVRVTAAVKTSGAAETALVLVDILDREHRGPVAKLSRGEEQELSIDAEHVGRPMAMLRAVRLYVKGEAVEISKLRFFCASERVPKPDAVVKADSLDINDLQEWLDERATKVGTAVKDRLPRLDTFVKDPKDGAAIGAALDSLGKDGGVVYIPAGTYVIKSGPIKIPSDNITIYGDGGGTIIQGTRWDHSDLILAEGKQNLRFTRLHFRCWPITAFRGYYNEKTKKPTICARAVWLRNCRNARIDHCEVERFGNAGVMLWEGGENLIDHCFFHENYRAGLGYAIAIGKVTKDNYIEDNNFENHRHAVAGGGERDTAYTVRFNRFVKDPKTVPTTGDWNQLAQHDIDHHGDVNGRLGASFVCAHDNYIAMKHGKMQPRGAIAMRGGTRGWFYRNVIVNSGRGICGAPSKGNVHTLRVWDNRFINVDKEYSIAAWRDDGSIVHFGPTPPGFAENFHPHVLNRLSWWPGAQEHYAEKPTPETQFAGPETPQVLRLVAL